MMNRAAVTIPEKLFFKIGEVCDIVGIQAHVLRYWESEFPMLAPQKNRAGQRTYRKRDVEMVLRIKELLYEEQYTIPGARKRLVSDMRGASKLKVVTPEMSAPTIESITPQTASSLLPVGVTPPPAAQYSPPLTPFVSNQMSDQSTRSDNSDPLQPGERQAVRRLRAQLHELLTMLDDDRR